MKNTPEKRDAEIAESLGLIADTLAIAKKEVRQTMGHLALIKESKGTRRSLVAQQLHSLYHSRTVLQLHYDTLEALIKKDLK